MVGVLREPEPGVEHEVLRLDAAFEQRVAPLAELTDDVVDDVVVDGARLHVGAVPAPVHRDEGQPVGRDPGHHLGVGQAARDVVDDGGPRLHRCPRDRGPHRVDGDDRALGGQRRDERDDAAQLLLDRRALGSGSRRLTAHVDDVGAGRHDVAAVRDGGVRLEPLPAVGEGVGRHVDDAHDERAVGHRQERGRVGGGPVAAG